MHPDFTVFLLLATYYLLQIGLQHRTRGERSRAQWRGSRRISCARGSEFSRPPRCWARRRRRRPACRPACRRACHPACPMPPPPPCEYMAVMIGVQMPSTSLRLYSNSSFSAIWLPSSHESASSIALVAFSLSSDEILSLTLKAASSAAYFSASAVIFSTSSFERRDLSLVIVILFSLPVDFSSADTLSMPLASMSKVTSICGTPRGIGGMPDRLNSPSLLLSFVRERSPSKTWMVTAGWLSEYVEKVCDFFVGTVVLSGMSVVITSPAVSRPSDSGVTSSSSRSSVSAEPVPERMAACTAAPYATASSGLMLFDGSLPLKKSVRSCTTLGIRVEPPTRTTSCTWFLDIWRRAAPSR